MLKYFLSLVLAFLFSVDLALAEYIPQELHINAKGEARFSGAEVFSKHALNYLTVKVWGQKWGIITDYTTQWLSAYGEKIKPEEVLEGHKVEIEGRPVADKVGFVEARIFRDLSIQTGTPPVTVIKPEAVAVSQVAGAVVSSRPPLAMSPLLAPKEKITRTLTFGMRGGEVATLQEFLQKNRFGIPNDGPVTGYFGKVTVSAVKNFQAANGLEAVGWVGPKTRELINSVFYR